MLGSITRQWPTLAVCGLVFVCVAGCGRSARDYIPAEDRARTALDQALTAWQNGQASHVTDVSPAVVGVDARWKKGATLAGYEVLDAGTEQGSPSFTVKLILKKPAGEKTVKYIVIGKDPLWVYSEEEYKAVSGL